MEKVERVAIFIDGSNLYHKLKDLKIQNTVLFNYRGFCDFLSRNRPVVSYKYYVGVVRAKAGDEKAQALRASQQKMFYNLEKQGFLIEKGFLMQSDGAFHEKGVDVKIATDMIIGAYEDLYDTAILISSDTDLIPAIKQVRSLGKKVEYIGFSHSPSIALQKNADTPRLLIEDDLKKFVRFLWIVESPYDKHLHDGQKKIDARLFKGIWNFIKIGNVLILNSSEGEKEFLIANLKCYKNFQELVEAEGFKNILPDKNSVEEVVNFFYSHCDKDDEEKFGVLAIAITQPKT
jgi:uncharacterized LabA/DUF88 family protein/ASC-1-like (ASCH) protein